MVGDVRAYGLTINPPPILYIPVAQTPEDLNTYLVRNTMSWIVHARTDPSLISLPIQNMLRQATGGLPVLSVQSMDEIVRQSAGSGDSNLLLMSILALWATDAHLALRFDLIFRRSAHPRDRHSDGDGGATSGRVPACCRSRNDACFRRRLNWSGRSAVSYPLSHTWLKTVWNRPTL